MVNFDTLNTEQRKAVEETEGPLLIVAGAGAGKTRVLTYRMINLIKKGVHPASILAITFTNKAAKEMRERVTGLISNDEGINRPVSIHEKPFVSTFHALGVHIIKENARRLGLTRHFTIYDRSDSKRAVKESLEKANLDPKKFDPNVMLNMISRAKGDGLTYTEYFDLAKGYLEECVARVWENYDAILAKDKALDFDDLLLKTAKLLGENEDLRKHYASVWKYIHIDEYQDTNKVQYKIARYLAEEHRNICVVGDADQNIYSWRGATIENILNFEKDYPEAKIVLLEKNYRSTKTILAAANLVIEKNRMRKKKTLYTENESGEKISVVVSYTDADEARVVADLSRGLIEKGVSAREIAILYRANFQSRLIEQAFINKQIPHQLVGTRFFERKEIRDVLSYIKASLNPDSSADIVRCINMPPRGIGKVTVGKVVAGMESSLPAATLKKVADFRRLLADMKHELLEKKPSESVRFVIQESGIERHLRSGDMEDEDRLLNIRELVSMAAQYDHLGPEEGIEAFLSNAALATDQDDLEKNEDAVKLMTVHASKGLEFDYVFIVGLEQDLFPFKHVDDAEISQSEEEEERRLFYVAITRARKKVYLSHAMVRTIYGAERINAPSEFINDISKELLDDQQPEKPSGAKAIFIDF